MEEINATQPEAQELVQSPIQTPAEPKKKKFLKSKWLLLSSIILVLIIISAGAAYFFLNSKSQVACTLEAKLCPDGSSVSRTGPKCEFSPCPKTTPTPTSTSSAETTSWKTYVNQEIGISFDYPSNWNPIYKDEEICFSGQGLSLSRIVNNRPCVGIYLSSSVVKNKFSFFFSTQSKIFSKFAPGRGLTWMDEFSISNKLNNTSPEEFINSLCKINNQYSCIKKINKNGVAFLKVLKPALDWDEVDEKEKISFYYYAYYVLNMNENFPIIILSAEPENPNTMTLKESEKTFDLILTNFKFINQISPTPTCRPRPACLDATPRCLIPETSDMCPQTIH